MKSRASQRLLIPYSSTCASNKANSHLSDPPPTDKKKEWIISTIKQNNNNDNNNNQSIINEYSMHNFRKQILAYHHLLSSWALSFPNFDRWYYKRYRLATEDEAKEMPKST